MYCYYCMKEVTGANNICEICGKSTKTDGNRSHLTPGTVLMDKYLVGNVLGQGGFGITYAGRDTTLDMRIAIKEYYPQGHASRDCLTTNEVTLLTGPNEQYFASGKERFLKEAKTLAKFNRAGNIVHARDFFELNGTAYIIMDYVEGDDLKHYLRANGPVSAQRLVDWFMPILHVLGKVHDAGLIHRDISPDNIIVENGELVLIDFGAARDVDVNKSLSVMLKPGYAPGEQYSSDSSKQGPWTDIYAVCATMYECITGQVPQESSARLFEDLLKKPSELGIPIPPHIENALMHGMANRYTERTQSMQQLISELKGESAAPVYADQKTVLMDDQKTVLMENSEMITGVQIDPLTHTAPVQTMQTMMQGAAVNPQAEQPVQQFSMPAQPQQQKQKKPVLALAAAACVALAVGGGIMYFAGAKQNDELLVAEGSSMTETVSEAEANQQKDAGDHGEMKGEEDADAPKNADAPAEDSAVNAAVTTPNPENSIAEAAVTEGPEDSEAAEAPARVTRAPRIIDEPVEPDPEPVITKAQRTEAPKTDAPKPETTKAPTTTVTTTTEPVRTEPPVRTKEPSDFSYEEWNGGILITGLSKEITSLDIPSYLNGMPVIAIGQGAFEGYPFIRSVNIPDTVTEIGRQAFNECENLSSVRLSGNLSIVGEFAFRKTGIEYIELPNSLHEIGTNAFYGMEYLRKIVIPSSVESIGDSAFGQCEWLETICIPTSVHHIGSRAFASDPICEGTVYYGGSSAEWNMQDFSSSAFPAVEYAYNVGNFDIV